MINLIKGRKGKAEVLGIGTQNRHRPQTNQHSTRQGAQTAWRAAYGEAEEDDKATMPTLATHQPPCAVIVSCLIYFHLRQKAPAGHAGRWAADEGHDAVAIHRAVPLDVAAEVGEYPRGAAALAVAAVAAVAAPSVAAADGDEEGIPAAFALLHRAVFVVGEFVLRARVAESALVAEDAALAVVSGEERGARDAEERLGGGNEGHWGEWHGRKAPW